MAAPAFRAAGGGPTNTTTATTIPRPAGTVAGDVLYALVTNGGAATPPSGVPSGWTLTIGQATGGGGWVGLYERVAGASEPADYTWSGFTDSCAGSMVAISGADTTAPTHAQHATATLNSSTPTDSGVTTTVPECLILVGVGIGDNTGATAWSATDPATLTERAEVQSTGGADTTSAMATAPQTSTGPTGTVTVTLAGSRNSVVITLSVQPPQEGGGEVTGTGAATLGALTGTANGTRRVNATASATLGGLTAVGSGVRRTSGTGAATLGALTSSATGVRATTGVASATLGALAATATGRPVRYGTAAAPLGGLTATAVGTSEGEIVGTGTAVLGELAAHATGLRTVHGQASAALGTAAATGTGTRRVHGTASAPLGAVAGAITVGATVRAGTGTALLGAVTGLAEGRRTVQGVASANLGALSAAVVLTGPPVEGTAAAALGGLTAVIRVFSEAPTVSTEFAYLLHDRGLGVFRDDGAAGGTIFLAALPSTPDRCKAVALYQGAEADSRLGYDEPRLQVRCRGTTDPRTSERDAQAVYDTLHGLGRVNLAGGTWLQLAVGLQAGPVYIGRDANGRHEHVVNFRAEISRPTVNRV